MDIHQLLSEGANPNIGSAEDLMNTPLHYACRYAQFRLCKLLLKAHCDLNQVRCLNLPLPGQKSKSILPSHCAHGSNYPYFQH